MKKIIGILGVAVIAATMFFTTNVVNSTSTDTSLGSLITLNTANALDAADFNSLVSQYNSLVNSGQAATGTSDNHTIEYYCTTSPQCTCTFQRRENGFNTSVTVSDTYPRS